MKEIDSRKWFYEKRTIYTGIYCKKHQDTELVRFTHPPATDYDPQIHGELTENGKQVTSIVFCSECANTGTYQKMQEERALKKANSLFFANNKTYKSKIFSTKSLVGNKKLWFARLNNFKCPTRGEEEVLSQAKRIARELISGNNFNSAFLGKAGTGKSHLSMAILQEVNKDMKDKNYSCLFVNVPELLKKLQESWNYSDTRTDESKIINLCRKVDLLVLDDLGTETTFSKDNSWSQSVLYNIMNSRIGDTIITTNLDKKALLSSYDSKLMSRLFQKSTGNIVFFNDLRDKRM